MKKLLLVVCTVVFACACACAAVGCSGGGGSADMDYTGHWVCSAVDDGTGRTEIASISEISGMTGEDFMTVDLNADGTAVITAFGTDITSEANVTWATSSSGVTLTANGEAIDMSYDSSLSELTMEYQGEKVVFTKA